MMKLQHTLTLLLSTLLVVAQATWAGQDDSAAVRWYQIEVFIFANTSPTAGINEQWPQELGLKYPARLEHLQQMPDQEAAVETASANLPTIGHTVGNPSPEVIPPGDPAPKAEGPTPFMLLDANERVLNRQASRISSRQDFRMLFHEAWRQPINNRQQAQSIVIRGGDPFDNHFELEGTISLGVERYLHINTDLWFSRFVSNTTLDTPWPVLPTPPEPPSLLDDIEITEEQTHEEHVDEGLAEIQQSLQEAPAKELPTEQTEMNLALSVLDAPIELLSDNKFTVDRTVTLRQHRRMRSGELHYIDHPLLGLMIKITPYEPAKATEQEPTTAGDVTTTIREEQPSSPTTP